MADQLKNVYYVGPNQPYKTVQKAIEEISMVLYGGDFELPPDSLADGGQVNIVIRGSGKHLPFYIPDNTTVYLKDYGRYLIIKREEYTSNGDVINSTLPVISPEADGAKDLDQEDLLIGCNIGNNNPNIKIQGLRVEGFLIGIKAGINCDNLYINRTFITNCLNTQVFVTDCNGVYITNNILVGGQYGLVAKFCKRLRVYHNTVYVEGGSSLGSAKAACIVQGERLFSSSTPSNAYVLGNLFFSVACPSYIVYDEDIKSKRLISNYNNIFAIDAPLVQLRSDSAQLSNEAEVITNNFYSLILWTQEAQLGTLVDTNSLPIGIDQNSISTHPVFIDTINSILFNSTSILDLNLLSNSPLLGKVPSWYYNSDASYIPSDFNEDIISVDCLLATREQPFTAIGANDSYSLNGFFGQDIFTSPLSSTQQQSCDVDPLNSISLQNVNMIYPEIMPGYFYSHERKYYLYGKKGAYQLGFLMKLEFKVPGFLHHKDISITINGKDIPENDWDISGQTVIVYTRTHGAVSLDDEIHISGYRRVWTSQNLSLSPVFYSYKVRQANIKYVLPDTYVPTGPVVITDDRVNYRDPIDVVRRDFTVLFNKKSQESEIIFGGNTNLVQNPQFDFSFDGAVPKVWSLINNSDAQLVSRDFAYIGDFACALKYGYNNGYIKSNLFPVFSGDTLTYSVHGFFPVTYNNETASFVATGELEIAIDFYNLEQEPIYNESVSALVNITDKYQRYYMTVGEHTNEQPYNIFESSTAPLVHISGNFGIPAAAAYSTISLIAPFNPDLSVESFAAVDGIMVEHSRYPTAYHQEPDPKFMTVEFETSTENRFVDKRMNLSPIVNENPNGFLYIVDMPAAIWGGPDNIETTTLHEYRWPEGRILTLPWARLFGKDKLTQKSVLSEIPTKPIDIIEPLHYPKLATQSNIYPGLPVAAQDDRSAYGLTIEVIDDAGNPFSLRNYTLTVLEEKNNFPGWLNKTYYGAKEQLGTTIFGTLNERGSAIASYVPPSSDLIKYIGPIPQVINSGDQAALDEDYISILKTNYTISPENNGNITIFMNNGVDLTTEGDEINGSFKINSDANIGPYVTLQYPPVFGSVSVYLDSIRYTEAFSQPQSNEFLVDYNNAHIVFKRGLRTNSKADIKYKPKYAYKDPSSSDTIILHNDKLFSVYNGPIEVNYDAEIIVEINVQQPYSGEYTDSFTMIAQNPKLSSHKKNPDALDF